MEGSVSHNAFALQCEDAKCESNCGNYKAGVLNSSGSSVCVLLRGSGTGGAVRTRGGARG